MELIVGIKLKRLSSLIVLLLLLTATTSLAKGYEELESYVEKEPYQESIENFGNKKNIFGGDKLQADGDQRVSELSAVFLECLSVLRQDKGWVAVIYYRDGDKTKRLTVEGSRRVKTEDGVYRVTAYSGGVRVTDLRLGLNYNLEIKGR